MRPIEEMRRDAERYCQGLGQGVAIGAGRFAGDVLDLLDRFEPDRFDASKRGKDIADVGVIGVCEYDGDGVAIWTDGGAAHKDRVVFAYRKDWDALVAQLPLAAAAPNRPTAMTDEMRKRIERTLDRLAPAEVRADIVDRQIRQLSLRWTELRMCCLNYIALPRWRRWLAWPQFIRDAARHTRILEDDEA